MKKGHKLVLVSALAVILALGFCLPVSAAVAKVVVTVSEVYVNDLGEVVIKVLRSNGVSKSFTVPDAEKNQMMAVALTALSLNKPVRMEADWADPNVEIISISIVNE